MEARSTEIIGHFEFGRVFFEYLQHLHIPFKFLRFGIDVCRTSAHDHREECDAGGRQRAVDRPASLQSALDIFNIHVLYRDVDAGRHQVNLV